MPTAAASRPLSTGRMSPLARLVALVNRYDNLCNPHVIAHALTPHEALSMLFAQSKTVRHRHPGRLHPMMGVYPPGSAVQLTDDRYALVVSVNSSRPLKPRVLVHERRAARRGRCCSISSTPRPTGHPPQPAPASCPRPRSPTCAAPAPYFFEPVATAA